MYLRPWHTLYVTFLNLCLPMSVVVNICKSLKPILYRSFSKFLHLWQKPSQPVENQCLTDFVALFMKLPWQTGNLLKSVGKILNCGINLCLPILIAVNSWSYHEKETVQKVEKVLNCCIILLKTLRERNYFLTKVLESSQARTVTKERGRNRHYLPCLRNR